MEKDASLFMSLDKSIEWKTYVADDFSLNIASHGDVIRRHGKIDDVYHVPILSANFLLVFQLIETGNILEFWQDRFLIKAMKKYKSILTEGPIHGWF